MPPSSVEFYLNLLATFCSPLLSNHWLMAVTAAIATLLIVSTALKYRFNTGLSSALLMGGIIFAFAPQPPHGDIPSESRANSGPTSTGIYGGVGSSTNDVYIRHSKFTNCDSGLENHGAMNNIVVDDSSFDCPPKFGVPPAASPPAALPDPSRRGQLTEPSQPRGTSGIYNSRRAVYDAAIDNFRSTGCEQGVRDIPSNAIWENVVINCGPPSVAHAMPPSGPVLIPKPN